MAERRREADPGLDRGLVRNNGCWTVRLEVDIHVLRGSGRPLRSAVVLAAGVPRGGSRNLRLANGSVRISWRHSRPGISSARSLIQALGCQEGDYLFIPLQDGRSAYTVSKAQMKAARGRSCVALQLGLPASSSSADIAQAIGLAADASESEVRSRLEVRREMAAQTERPHRTNDLRAAHPRGINAGRHIQSQPGQWRGGRTAPSALAGCGRAATLRVLLGTCVQPRRSRRSPPSLPRNHRRERRPADPAVQGPRRPCSLATAAAPGPPWEPPSAWSLEQAPLRNHVQKRRLCARRSGIERCRPRNARPPSAHGSMGASKRDGRPRAVKTANHKSTVYRITRRSARRATAMRARRSPRRRKANRTHGVSSPPGGRFLHTRSVPQVGS